MKFSVLMSIYKNEQVEYFKTAMDSVLRQTVQPDEIVLVRDGPVSPELQCAIDSYLVAYPSLFAYIPLQKNCGLGKALQIGTNAAKYNLVARMDTDDICVQNRFELQLQAFRNDNKLDVVGGQIEEFIGDSQNVVGKRMVPCSDSDIKKFMKKRNPFNHMSVMFRRSSVLQAGNYQDMHYIEDYYLWCRMAFMEFKFCNLEQTLIYARVSKDMYKRRGGYRYFRSWKRLEKIKLENHMTNIFSYVFTLTVRFIVQVILPNGLRSWVFRTFSRKKVKSCNS